MIKIPRRGTRGDRLVGGLLLRLLRPLYGSQVRRFQNASSAEPVTFNGLPMLVLTTIGAETGQERNTPLAGFPDGPEAWLIVASKGGSATNPAWLYNLAKNPDNVWAQVGNHRFRANVVSLEGEERAAAYKRVVQRSSQYAGYERKTDREIPVLRVTPAR